LPPLRRRVTTRGMALVTLRVLDGADRGRAFEDVPTPLTVGREEGNPVQLNDERISRFHIKIQEDGGKLVLTDLESTNGSKVNGESAKICLLRPGDIIAVGRSLLLVGSREEIARRLAFLRNADLSEAVILEGDNVEQPSGSGALDFELALPADADARLLVSTVLPPDLPDFLQPGQAAQLSELLTYFSLRLRGAIESVKKDKRERVTIDQRQWQNLLELQARLAAYLREIGEPAE
jgi:pSer/pThr/pTyr-binding forkhead associated (FHA) protein